MGYSYRKKLQILENRFFQKDLAKALGVSDRFLRYLKEGKRKPSQSTIQKIDSLYYSMKEAIEPTKIKKQKRKNSESLISSQIHKKAKTKSISISIVKEREFNTEEIKIEDVIDINKIEIIGRYFDRVMATVIGISKKGNIISKNTPLITSDEIDLLISEIKRIILEYEIEIVLNIIGYFTTDIEPF